MRTPEAFLDTVLRLRAAPQFALDSTYPIDDAQVSEQTW